MDECTVLNINTDFVKKLEIFKKLIGEYEDEIYNKIIDDIDCEKYLKLREDKNKNGSDRNRFGDNI